MDSLFSLVNAKEEEKFTDSKEDILKFLKIIGVDTRFISLTDNRIYINNLRFSKFSRTREATFYKQYPEMKVVRSSLFMKICSKTSKVLADSLYPGVRLHIPDGNEFLKIVLEPYTRKYGVKIVREDYDFSVSPLILDDEVNSIFSDIFKGAGIDFTRRNSKEIYPLITTEKEWILSFCSMENIGFTDKNNDNPLACDFMEFLEDVAPQYRENVIKATDYLKEKN